jgi:hypothetical protein
VNFYICQVAISCEPMEEKRAGVPTERVCKEPSLPLPPGLALSLTMLTLARVFEPAGGHKNQVRGEVSYSRRCSVDEG